LRIDPYGSTQSEPKQSFDLFELTRANEISLVAAHKKTASKCCNDPLRPPRFSGLGAVLALTRMSQTIYTELLPARMIDFAPPQSGPEYPINIHAIGQMGHVVVSLVSRISLGG
jgi:hypothetical protein